MTRDMALTVTVHEQSHQVPVGGEFRFGRNPGPGQLGADDSTVSRVHGCIYNESECWSITSTGSFFGFVIHDLNSASTLEVPAGAGPFTMPLRSVMIVVPGRHRHVLAVSSPHPLTERNPSPDAVPELATNAGATEPVVAKHACFGRDGRPLRWFQVLVALCEPRLRAEGGGIVVPTDQEIRRRLGMGSSSFDRAFARARQELNFEAYTPMVRVAMATTALHQGIVEPADIALLDQVD